MSRHSAMKLRKRVRRADVDKKAEALAKLIEEESAEQLKPGQAVRLKGRAMTLVDGHMYGGEGTVYGVHEDAKGVWYSVRMTRDDSVRAARREDLVVHRG